ncbi:uncharacterized protein SPAPADRAFT_51123 [Spathaspora passalidarum NRRL Y-27907]|uniref:FHA domain-containing protein n=1 Tax=Spathaspora passalidarum (strain NRRL Y-27907 / 11-Y1) TaxID=619300 RepID=G3ANV5_SPAPN|nr:uncharacterized protein SPAPADRAFT_51123 [Spathaspora passalidarum NRRL Y-27907]EGW32580.1 hypothetical protein SPAPADRAFT_51123 [Spathaspora passalidarum NRRL Y-27907]
MPTVPRLNHTNTRIDPGSVDSILEILQEPEQRTLVADKYANSKIIDAEVKAYAKLAGSDWTYYIKKLSINIGRSSPHDGPKQDNVDIDLYPNPAVSRQHAIISYNLHVRCWELKVVGRNGIKVDGHKNSTSVVALRSGCVINIMGTEIMFIEANSNITISPRFAALVESINRKSVLLKDDTPPPYTYTTMIAQAILADQEGLLPFDKIYSWILNHYPYYECTRTTTSLHKSIAHTLNTNKAFESVNENPSDKTLAKWQINEKYRNDLLSYMSLEYQFTKFPTIANFQDASLRLSIRKSNQ